jgi:hypothetical protein
VKSNRVCLPTPTLALLKSFSSGALSATVSLTRESILLIKKIGRENDSIVFNVCCIYGKSSKLVPMQYNTADGNSPRLHIVHLLMHLRKETSQDFHPRGSFWSRCARGEN